MRRTRRHWSRLSWSLWIIFLAVAAAVACASHPPSHDHDAAHPPLCADTSSPAALAHDKPTLFPNGGTFPLSPTSLFPLGSLAALSGLLLVGLFVWSGALRQSDARTSISPPTLLVVLRQ
jgi:hypothetical protein